LGAERSVAAYRHQQQYFHAGVPSADEAIITMRNLASVAAFVREQCEVAANREISVNRLYAA
jgi:hypothetical protein